MADPSLLAPQNLQIPLTATPVQVTEAAIQARVIREPLSRVVRVSLTKVFSVPAKEAAEPASAKKQ